MIFKIAKNELRNLFYSPVAWFIILAFFVQCAFFYFKALEPLANATEILSRNNPEGADRLGLSATIQLLLRKDSLFKNIIGNLYLFVPLLTMGLINREINSGSVRLLTSSPIRLRDIVFGKYIGVMLFNLLLLAIIAIFMVVTAIHVRNVDYGILLCSMLGFYLLLGTYSAIGLYMSAITNYQVVAALSTFMILFCFTKIGGLWQQYDVIRDITWFLSVQDRVEKMLTGLLRTKDVIYYIVITCLFIGCTLIRLRRDQESATWFKQFRRYALVLVVGLLVGYISSRPQFTGYWDTTYQKFHTIPEKLQHLLQSFDKDSTLEITVYANVLGREYKAASPAKRNVMLDGIWDPYIRFKPDIKFKYEYYYDYNPVTDHHFETPTDSLLFKQHPGKTLEEIAERYAVVNHDELSSFKSPGEMRQSIDLDPEGYRLVMTIKYKGRVEFLRTFNDMGFWPDYRNIGGALKRLQSVYKPRIGFITGHLERDIYKPGDREYRNHSSAKDIRGSALNLGFTVDTLNLARQDISNDFTAIVLADPKVELAAMELRKLKTYIDGGGNMMILGVPGKQHIVNPVLEELGLRFMPRQLASNNFQESSELIHADLTPEAVQLAPESILFAAYQRDLKDKKKHTHLDELEVRGVVGIEFIDTGKFKAVAYSKTHKGQAWLKAKPLIADSAKAVFTPADGDSAGVFPVGVMLSRNKNNKEQRIMVFNGMINENGEGGGSPDFYSWLHYNEFPIYHTPIYPIDQIRIGNAAAMIWKVIFIWILPALILVAGTILLLRRHRK
jgi:ABC-2 type transport system permease protein